jgi:hypothetical protein
MRDVLTAELPTEFSQAFELCWPVPSENAHDGIQEDEADYEKKRGYPNGLAEGAD